MPAKSTPKEPKKYVLNGTHHLNRRMRVRIGYDPDTQISTLILEYRVLSLHIWPFKPSYKWSWVDEVSGHTPVPTSEYISYLFNTRRQTAQQHRIQRRADRRADARNARNQ